MGAIPKIVGVMTCGVLLCLGLSGNAVSAADVMKAGQSGERIGGQAGGDYEHVRQGHVATVHAGDRLGGQAGLGYAQVKQGHITMAHAGDRIGGQAGL